MKADYAKLSKGLKACLSSNYEKMKKRQFPDRVRRVIHKGDITIKVNIPGWGLAVLYDDLSLFMKLAKKELPMLTSIHKKLVIVEQMPGEGEISAYEEFDFDLVWYWAQGNQNVTEKLLFPRLEAFCEEAVNRDKLRIIRRILQGYLALGEEDHKQLKKRAQDLYQWAPKAAKLTIGDLVKGIGKQVGAIFYVTSPSVGELFLLAEIMKQESTLDHEEALSMEWYQGLLFYTLNMHCNSMEKDFEDAGTMLTSLNYFIHIFLKAGKRLASQLLDVLLWGWNEAVSMQETHKDMSVMQFVGIPKDGRHLMSEDVWKKVDQMFQKLVMDHCEEYPGSVTEMIARNQYFPSARQLCFLSHRICHGPIVIPEKNLAKREWNYFYEFMNSPSELRKKEEDVQIFQWITIKKGKGKKLTRMEKQLLNDAPEDVLRAAGQAGMFPAEKSQLYIDFSRRFGRLSVIPLLIGLQKKGAGHEKSVGSKNS